MGIVTSEKELGEALKRNDDVIEVELDLARKVVKIKTTEKGAWVICVLAISAAVASVGVAVATGGTTAPADALIAVPATAGAASILGIPTAVAAVQIAIVGGGVGALNKLRNYRLEKISDTKVILYRKK